MLENKNDIFSITESVINSSSNLSTIKSRNIAVISFKVKYETNTGQDVYILGNTKEFGFWNPLYGLKLETDEVSYPFWHTSEDIKYNIGTEFRYKYATINSFTNKIEWESNMPDRLYKVENKGAIEINEEKGNKNREIKPVKKKHNLNPNSLIPKTIGTCSPINDRNVYHIKDLTDYEIELRGSICPSENDENNRLINAYMNDILNYDQVKIDAMQKNLLTIGLKRQIELNPKEDKFIILTALLPFNIIKNTNNVNNNKYTIVPKYEDELYESLFNLRKDNIYEIYWFGMLENCDEFCVSRNDDDEKTIDKDLIDFLKEEKIYVITPKLNDYNNYWIYISHIIGKIFYENKIPVNDTYFMEYETYFDSYKKINELFAKEIINEGNFDKLIMINDINLALVPHFITQKNHFAKLGFYLNNIFPSIEVFKSLQYQEEILQSILLCNLICFHHIETAMKFLNTIQRNLDLNYEIKPGGKIIINYQGRNVNIHIMQAGIDIKKLDNILKKKEFMENCGKIKKKYKNFLDLNQKDKYIYFSVDGLHDINKIVMKLQAFDIFYDLYLKEFKRINHKNIEKIVEVNEENCNNNENIDEKTTTNEQNDTITSNSKNDDKNIINDNINIQINKIKTKNYEIEEDIKNNHKIIPQTNKILKKNIKTKKPKIKKGKSKSGTNLSNTPPDIQKQKLENQIKEIYATKEPLFIQIIKPSESKLMNLYNFSTIDSQKYKEQIENNLKKLLSLVQEINKKHKKEIIILINEENKQNNFSFLDLYSLYAIGDCYYCLRKDYNFSLHIQSFIYISNYMDKKYDLITSENACISPGIRNKQKVNDFNIKQNKDSIHYIFLSQYKDTKVENENNINFIRNNQILNWCKIFFSNLKKVSFYENDSQKKIYGFGLGFSLMKLNYDFCHLDKKIINNIYRESNQNLIIIDYTSIKPFFEENNSYQKENLLYQLKILATQEKNKIYIISSSTKSELEQNFKDIFELGLACEYGFYYKPPRETDYLQLKYIEDWTWKQGIMPILNGFTERTEGSYIIQKESMISWSYEKCESDFGLFQANEMISHIKTLLLQNDFIVVENDIEKNVVNIRPKNINKGSFIAKILKQDNINGEFPEFILAIGGRDGDELMFKYLNYLMNNFEIKTKIYTAVVNKRVSSANYYLKDENEILEYIENFNKIDKSEDIFSSKLSYEMVNLSEEDNDLELDISSKDNILDE